MNVFFTSLPVLFIMTPHPLFKTNNAKDAEQFDRLLEIFSTINLYLVLCGSAGIQTGGGGRKAYSNHELFSFLLKIIVLSLHDTTAFT